MKANSKPWFDTEMISTIQKTDKLNSIYKKSLLETDKYNFRTAEMFSIKYCMGRKSLSRGKTSSKLKKP